MAYFRAFLSGLAALLLGIFGPPLFFAFRDHEKATGIDVFRVFSPLSAGVTVIFFGVFFAASRLLDKRLRLLLFWTPVAVVSTLGLGLCALIVLLLHVSRP